MQKTISTELLAQMLRSIALQRRTGLLRVEQLGAGSQMQGEIYFQGGRPTHAQTDQATGQAALLHISSWKNIICSFDGILPETQFRLSTPQRRVTQPLVREEKALEKREPEPSPAKPQFKKRLTTRLIPEPSSGPPTETLTSSSVPEGRPFLPGPLAIFRARSRIIPARSLEHLERRERIIFVLLDGKRTIQDIARLIRCSEVEVQLVLVHLTRRGYTEHVPEPPSTNSLEETFVNLFSHSNEDKEM